MQDEDLRLKNKLQKLEDILEKQRWTQKEAAIRFEKTVARLEQENEELKFDAAYNKEQARRYQAILDNLEEGIWVMDGEGNVVSINSRARELIDENAVTPLLYEASSPEGEPLSVDIEEEERLTISVRPIKDSDGQIVGSLAVVRIRS
ncbi:MAG: PAS domain S-box protein [Candidatus Melainabacteria bacterium]|nr:PAS domain S-box protein [Candidatus Melainabacteria bacterium]